MLPDLSQNKIFLKANELTNSFLVTAMVTLIISILFLKRSKMGQKSTKSGEIANITNVSSIGLLFRFLTMMVIGHFFRVLTYPLTSLPGPAKVCLISYQLIIRSSLSEVILYFNSCLLLLACPTWRLVQK